MNWFRQRFVQFFFTPSEPTDLAVCRIVVCAGALALYWHDDPSQLANAAASWQATPIFKLLGLPLLSGGALATLGMIWKGCLGCASMGFGTRLSVPAAAALGFYLMGLKHCFGKVYASDPLLITALMILAVSRCGDALAVDRLLRPDRKEPPKSPEYTWPIRLMWVMFALMWFSAGTAKLRYSGFEWALSDNMSNLLAVYWHLSNPPLKIGPDVANHAWICRMIAVSSLGLETLSPLILVSGTARLVFGIGLFGMQLGIWALMGIPYFHWLPCYAFLVPWTALHRRLTQ